MALDDDEKEIAELWRLLKAFEQITDLKVRRQLIEQIEELVSTALATKTMMAVITTGKTNLVLPSMRVSEPLR